MYIMVKQDTKEQNNPPFYIIIWKEIIQNCPKYYGYVLIIQIYNYYNSPMFITKTILP